MVLNEPALVLNRNWVPVDVTTVLKAICKVYDGAARALEPANGTLHDFDSWSALRVAEGQPCIRTAKLTLAVPEVIVLGRYADVPRRAVAFSRRNLYQRDHCTCQYCGARPGTAELTIDHIVPRARGGTSTWTNCVLACLACNKRKADRSPAAAGMALKRKPIQPRWTPRLVLARLTLKASWEHFVSEAYWNVELRP